MRRVSYWRRSAPTDALETAQTRPRGYCLARHRWGGSASSDAKTCAAQAYPRDCGDIACDEHRSREISLAGFQCLCPQTHLGRSALAPTNL